MEQSEVGGEIVRVKKNRYLPYVMINKELTENSKLSWEARGVMCYLLGKPDDWQIMMRDLVNRGPGKWGRMRRILKELSEAGYIYRERRHVKGRWCWESTVYENPEENPDWCT